ncbi:sensor histidine kinase [Arcobacter arenosus]|jgi:signal transduction histidine kinase|uniref:histidine kinase n=1 Tax=Arcobacter arenosus TaxID=2576037 RepID=A0A5R8XXQ9_9BACT|nr:HAMP domain-containing sensor histidine kinase [Arcobacter arenosus]TLP35776.1 HAMP domain-containing histidine kinase [Arcobacter arenosus]
MDNKYLDSLFNNTIEGIIIIEDGFIKNINNAMLDILKYEKKEELINKLATGILIPNIHKKFLEFNNDIYEEVTLFSKNAEIVPAIIKIKDFEYENSSYKILYVLNLTELKQNETLLIEQSRMAAMGEMISMIAHQWKQPLASIAAAISNLKFRLEIDKIDKESLQNKLVDMDKYIIYMSETIDDFRNFFKKDKEKMLVSLDYIVDISLEMLNKPLSNIKVTNKKIKLNKLYIYKNELLQVMLNILNNSQDAFSENKIENPTINISYKETHDEQIIIIKDNAGGIPKNIIDKIFDPYFTTKEKRNGTGLGLYMCKTIIEKHFKGEIKVKSEKQNTSFKIIINKFI